MLLTPARSAAGIALLAALAAGCSSVAAAYHPAHRPAAAAHYAAPQPAVHPAASTPPAPPATAPAQPPNPIRRATAATRTPTTTAVPAMATATSDAKRIAGRRYVLAAIAAVAAIAVTAVAVALSGRPPGRAFPPLHPAAAPAGWRHATLPNGTAVLSYPPSLHPIEGDTGTVSAARLGPGGAFQLYLNVTPRQGAETLAHWAAFRLAFLRADNAATVHLDAAATGVAFRGGTGSCVIDDYITRAGGYHFQEIACLVQGRHGGSVGLSDATVDRVVRGRQHRRVVHRAAGNGRGRSAGPGFAP